MRFTEHAKKEPNALVNKFFRVKKYLDYGFSFHDEEIYSFFNLPMKEKKKANWRYYSTEGHLSGLQNVHDGSTLMQRSNITSDRYVTFPEVYTSLSHAADTAVLTQAAVTGIGTVGTISAFAAGDLNGSINPWPTGPLWPRR
jgi:hypothetical protein